MRIMNKALRELSVPEDNVSDVKSLILKCNTLLGLKKALRRKTSAGAGLGSQTMRLYTCGYIRSGGA